jgi:stage II sporulation protein D
MLASFRVFLVVGLVQTAFPGVVAASEMVRLAVCRGRSELRVEGKKIHVIDADLKERLFEKDKGLVLRSAVDGIRLPGSSYRPRSVILRAADHIRLAGRVLIGEVEIRLEHDGLLVINRIDLERYLQGLLGAEMSATWPLDALRAQAVAARTYFLHKRLGRENSLYDLESSTLHQVYIGIGRESKQTRLAVESTLGQVLTWGNLPAETLYHSCCGGRTRSAQAVFGTRVEYLVPVGDPYCRSCPKHRWKRVVSLKELTDKLEKKKRWRGPLKNVELTPGGLVFHGPKHAVITLSRRAFRSFWGPEKIPSSQFVAKTGSGNLILQGHGSGHGVGMCQWGAKGMAEQGWGYRKILEHYYPSCDLKKFY